MRATTARQPACRTRTSRPWRVASRSTWTARPFAGSRLAICPAAVISPANCAACAPRCARRAAMSARGIRMITAKPVQRPAGSARKSAERWRPELRQGAPRHYRVSERRHCAAPGSDGRLSTVCRKWGVPDSKGAAMSKARNPSESTGSQHNKTGAQPSTQKNEGRRTTDSRNDRETQAGSSNQSQQRRGRTGA